MDERLDAAIDEVAREMTAAEPPATLRADVLARIARERGGRTDGLLVPRWAWAGAAAAAILIVGVATTVWLSRTVPGPDRQPVTSARASASQPAPVTAPVMSAAVTTASAHPAQAARAARRPAAETRRLGLPDDVGPAPLAGPDAIDIAPLEPAAIAIPELRVAALGDIEPITVPTIGPGSPEPQRRDRE